MPIHMLEGTPIAKKVRAQVHETIEKMRADEKDRPCLVILSVGKDTASEVYVRSKMNAALDCGIVASHRQLYCTQDELISYIAHLNEDPGVHAIILQLPLPKDFDTYECVNAISPMKDVDCLTAANQGLLIAEHPRYVPCTPAGIVRLLDEYDVCTMGRTVAILGRSQLVGRPLANMLSTKRRGATVTLFHSWTPSVLYDTLRDYDIIISAVGKKGVVNVNHLIKFDEDVQQTIIDVGINRDENGKIAGDFDLMGMTSDDYHSHISLTPVPGGVGPMTVAMLMKNTMDAWLMQRR